MNKLKSLVAGAALVTALAAGPTQEATAQEQQGPRFQIGTSIEYMPNNTREVPNAIHVTYDEQGFPTHTLIPGGKRETVNELRHGIALYDTKNGNHYGIKYNARTQNGIYNEFNPKKEFDAKEINYDISINTLRKQLQINLDGRVDGKWTSNEFMVRPGKSPVHVGYGFETYGTPFEAISHKLRFLLDTGLLKSNSDSTGAKVANALIPDSVSSKLHLKSQDRQKDNFANQYADRYDEVREYLRENPSSREAFEIVRYLDAFRDDGPRYMSFEAHWDLNNSIKRHINSGARYLIPSGITLKHDSIGRVNGIGDSSSYLLTKLNKHENSEIFDRTNIGTSVKLSWDIPLGRSKPTTNQ